MVSKKGRRKWHHKLKKLQTIRRIEREDAEEKAVAKASAAHDHNSDFVKQTQSPAFGGKREIRNPKRAELAQMIS